MKTKSTANGGDGMTAVAPVTNGGQAIIETAIPYIASLTLTGVADILFHAWNVESVETKGKAAKGSAAKKSDDVESYIYRNAEKFICVPGEYLRGAIIGAAKFRQDPRSPRKSAQDLFKAGVVSMTPLALINGGVTDWDYLDRRRVQVQRNGITRTRPAFLAGWSCTIDMMVNLPEYIPPAILLEVATNAGRLIGLADFRPTYGRFLVSKFDVMADLVNG